MMHYNFKKTDSRSRAINKQIKAEQKRYRDFCFFLVDNETSESAEKEIRSQMNSCIVMIRKLCEELSFAIEQELIAQRKDILSEQGEEEDLD